MSDLSGMSDADLQALYKNSAQPLSNDLSKLSDADLQAMYQQARPSASLADWVQAAEGGILGGTAYLLGSIPDAAANLYKLGKAGLGAGYQAITGKPGWDVGDPSPVGAWLSRQLDKSPVTTTQPSRPDDMLSRYLRAGATAIPGAAVMGGGSIPAFLGATAGAQLPIAAGQTVQETRPFESDAANNAAAIGAQLLVGQVQPLVGAGIRGLIRGGEEGRQNMLDTTQSFRELGAEPSLGQASGNRGVQAVESGLAKLPGASGVMERAAAKQAAAIGEGASDVVTSLSPHGASAERAGRAITEGITGSGGFKDRFQTKAATLYNAVDDYIPADSPIPVSNTLNTLDKLSAQIPGAPETSGLLSNAKVAAISNALRADAGEGGVIPYQALSSMRSKVGALLGSSELISDIPRGQLKQLYGALSSDMETAATAAGPQAAQAFSRANTYYKAGLDRIETLQGLVNKDAPEGVFNAAMSGTRDGATTLRSTLRSLDTDDQKTVAATVIKRMGMATAGQQDATGEMFSPQTFLTNWNRMSPEAKTALFDRFEGLREKVDNIAEASSTIRSSSRVFANASGTTPSAHMVGDLAKVLGSAGFIFHETGSPWAAAGVLGAAGMGNVLARQMTNPSLVDWAGQRTNFFGPGQQAALVAAPANFSAQLHKRIADQLLANKSQ